MYLGPCTLNPYVLLISYGYLPPLAAMVEWGQHIATGHNGPALSFGYKNLYFDGDERKFEIWNEKFLGCMKIKKLKDILVGTGEVTQDDNENAYSELVQFLDERSIS